MRIVIAGAGEVGTHLAEKLSRENHEIVVIDSDSDKLNNLSETSDLLTRQGVVTSIQLLTETGAGKADLFIAVTPFDDTNIVSAMIAKKLGAKLTVVRISNSEPLNKENREIYTGFGIDSFVYPEKIAAREIANTLRQSGISTIVEFSNGKLTLLAVKVEKNAPIVDKTQDEVAQIHNIEYCTVAILRNGITIIPYDEVRYEPDDTIYVVTNQAEVKKILQYSGQGNEKITQVMIFGGSHIGRLIAKELEKSCRVKIFEVDRNEASRLSDTLSHAMVIHGDGSKTDLLLEEGVRTTDAFIAVTGNSEANILACTLAKNEGVTDTIAEVENLDYINLAERMGVDTIINKKLIAAGHIYRYTLSSSVTMIKYLAPTEAEALEFVAPPKSKITELPLKEIDFPKDAIIGGFVRDKVGHVATGNAQIKPGDHVVVFAMPAAISEISRFFK
jgi:trk system potassium uptake protein TrkA